MNRMYEEYKKDHLARITDEEVLETISENKEKVPEKKIKERYHWRGLYDVAVHFSKCCSPVPGDEIVGFVTRGRGVSIHRTDCINIINLSDMERERLIDAEWQHDEESGNSGLYLAEIKVFCNNRTGLLVDITNAFTERAIDINAIHSKTSKQGIATIDISFNTKGKAELTSVIDKLRQIDSIIDIERTTGFDLAQVVSFIFLWRKKKMAPLSIQIYVVDSVQTNCYFAINDDTKEVLIIDPGASAKQLAEKVKEQGLKPVAILLTHGHFDHATGAGELAQLLHIKIYAQEKEKETLENPQLNLSGWQGSELVFYADEYLKDEQEIDLAGFHIRVFLTPGHTVGGCCYYFPYQNTLFSGDSLFHASIGRTDFPKGSASQLIHAIREKLMPLPDETAVYTGHGDMTTIGTERMYNPYL